MAVRPDMDTTYQLRRAYKVATGQTVTRGGQVILATDDTVQGTVAEDQLAIGIAEQDGIAGESVSIVMFGTGIVHVIVGTGDAVRGRLAVAVADGHTSVTIADGAVVRVSPGRFLQSGVAGDEVGLLVHQQIITAA